ncbi:hypothetical protein I7I51_00362 [Histoplasma capsulatum]|uniref:Secreted protein n=1 Tax=Ajellomyces capsulatus TaxID=5037 RepID=A0A8A1MBU6_AJECA|nr:hypothetical protein I7I51_00362 [Histoplasma capsulatum]
MACLLLAVGCWLLAVGCWRCCVVLVGHYGLGTWEDMAMKLLEYLPSPVPGDAPNGLQIALGNILGSRPGFFAFSASRWLNSSVPGFFFFERDFILPSTTTSSLLTFTFNSARFKSFLSLTP